MRYRLITSAAFLVKLSLTLGTLFTLHLSLFSQQVAQPSLETTGTTTLTTADVTTGTAAPADDIVQLSPFTVTGQADRGFEALNTTSGSRVRTPLRDTAATIQPFTTEFLDSIGASTMEDIMSYAANIESDDGDAVQAGSVQSDATRGAGNNNTAFRARGLPMSVAMDYFPIALPINRYNIDRTEISYGANSILFGLGEPGGLVNHSSKQANPQRNILTIENTIGTWSGTPNGGIPYYEGRLDYNLVLAPKTAALRILGLYTNGSNRSWRYNMGSHDKRINPTLQIKPFKNTAINLTYETGRLQDSTYVNMNLDDGFMTWASSGSAPIPTFTDAVANGPIGTAQLAAANQGAASSMPPAYFVVVDGYNANPGTSRDPYSYRRAYETPKNPNYGANGLRLPAELSSYYYNPVGPGGTRVQKFDRFQVSIDQRFGNFNLQLAYNHNKNHSTALAPYTNSNELQADPNYYISPAAYTSGPGTIANPNAMRYYVEDYWENTINNQTYDTFRATGDYSFNWNSLGRHRLVAVIEHGEAEQLTQLKLQTYVDQYGVPYNIAANIGLANGNINATAPAYMIRHRQYVTWGDFTTYYAGDIRNGTPGFTYNGHDFRAAWLNQTTNMTHIKSTTDSGILVLQSYFLKDRLATTLGFRRDYLSYQTEKYDQIFNYTDPRVLNHTASFGEYAFNGTWSDPHKYQPYTLTAGAVYHLLDWLSPFINYSTNRAPPYMDNRLVFLTSDASDPSKVTGLAPPSKGSSLDYGVMLSLFSNKLSIRLTRFQTRMKGDASIAPGGQGADSSQATGSTNLVNIYNALYLLSAQPGGATTLYLPDRTQSVGLAPGSSVALPDGTTQPVGTYTDTNGNTRGYGPMSPSMYGKSPPVYNSGLSNSDSRGYELMITGNLTKNITLMAGASYTDRQRDQIMYDAVNFYNTNIPKWMSMASPTLDANGNPSGTTGIKPNPAYVPNPHSSDGLYYVTLSNGSGGTVAGATANYMTLYNFLKNQLWEPDANAVILGGGTSGSVRQSLAQQMLNQAGQSMGGRTFKFQFRARYMFDDGWLKGFSVSPGVRYQSPAHMPDINRLSVPGAFAADGMPADGTVDIAMNPDVFTNAATMFEGTSLLFYDIGFGYKMKLFGGRTTMRLQFNIDNIFNNYVVTVMRVGKNYTWARTYLNQPRSFRLTATFDF